MLFLEYLFFKFYFFQVKVGEDVDIAPYTTLMCLCLIFPSWRICNPPALNISICNARKKACVIV